jgi:trk system potassium uptake protein TrkH
MRGVGHRARTLVLEPAHAALTAWRRIRPVRLLVGSFALLMVMGTIGLRTLPGLYTGEPLSWTDAAFTATSAVCITGLIVVDTATHFTFAGQLFLLVLVQLGGLGIIAFTTLVILSLGRRMSLRHETLTGSVTDIVPHIDPRRLARDVLRFTFIIEGVGAVLLCIAFVPRFGVLEGSWHAVFHAINSFCNAGFSTFSDNLMSFRHSPVTIVTVTVLVVLGGLGFLTMEELYLQRQKRRGGRAARLSLHSRLVLAVSAVLLLGGWLALGVSEWNNTLRDLSFDAKLLNSMFMSVTPRSSGFTFVDYGQTRDSTNFLTILLMFIGGSPGSTAGGVKTTTVALIALLAWSRFRGHEITSVWGRSVPEETLQRAVGVCAIAFGLVTLAVLILVSLAPASEPGGATFLAWMFEATSAFNTVGLSMGATDELTPGGRWLSVLLMYVGRVGPLAFAASIALPRATAQGEFRYAYEDVVVG